MLPKIHKPPTDWPIPGKCPLGRPIISDCGSESYGSAEYLDHFRKTQELYQGHELLHWKSEIPNTNTWIVFSVFHGCRRSLHKHRHTRAWKTLQNNPDEKRPDEHILDLLHMNLTCNDFVFNQKTYLHIKGTAMGKRFSLAYVNTSMAEWEESAFLPLIYLRYLNDIWGIWTHSAKDFEGFVQTLNNHHPSIKLKPTLDPTEINFLDTTTFRTRKLDIKIYFKLTDSNALLHKTSFHPKHTFKGIVYSQLRVHSEHGMKTENNQPPHCFEP